MSDLISRSYILHIIEIWMKVPSYSEAELNIMKGIDYEVRTAPSAEKKAKWEDIVELDSGGYPFKVGVCCSACGVPTLSEDNYCPNCGAKMEVSE